MVEGPSRGLSFVVPVDGVVDVDTDEVERRRGGSVKYVLMLCSDVSEADPAEAAAAMAGCGDWAEEMRHD